MHVLLFWLNGVEYGILLKDVEFISEKINVVKVPNALKAVSGIVMLRGKGIPIYSLALRLGFVEQEYKYLVVVKMEDIEIALEVEMINKIVWIEEDDVISLPAMVSATQLCFREALVYREKLIGLLDVGGLVSRQDRKELCMFIEKSGEEITPAERI